MDGEGRKGLLVLATIMALALGALTYFLFVVHPPKTQDTAGSRAAPIAPPTALLPAATPAPLAPDEDELCGYGRVTQSEADVIRAKARMEADKVFSGLKERLATSRDPHESALGLYLKGSTETLAALASASGDPQVYALAFLSCNYQASGGTCALLSAEQWAVVEPDNAVPLLLVATHHDMNDPAVEEAIYRAAVAKRFDPHFPNFLGLLELPDIQSQAPQTRSVLQDDLLAMRLTLPSLPLQRVYRYCNFPSVADATRIGVCNDLAKLFIERDQTMAGLGIGVKLAQTAAWPQERIEDLSKTKAEYQEALSAETTQRESQADSDCAELASFDRWAAEYERLGDRGMATKLMAKTASAADRSRRH
jgi:hypothetical protein